MSTQMIVGESEFIRRQVAATLATAQGKSPRYLLGMRSSRSGMVCALQDGAGLIGTKIAGDFDHIAGQRIGYVEQAAAREIIAWIGDRIEEEERWAAEDEMNERFAEAMRAHWPEILALYRANVPLAPAGSYDRFVSDALCLTEPDPPSTPRH